MKDNLRGQVTGLLSPFLRRARNMKTASFIPDGSRILDLGCGGASLLETLLSQGKKSVSYTGVDSLADCISAAAEVYPSQSFARLDIETADLSSLGGPFDVVTLIAVVEHLRDPQKIFIACRGLLSDKGKIIATAPRRGAESLYSFGGKMSLFSKEADDEHSDKFPDKAFLENLGAAADLHLVKYERFLLGMNQIAIYEKKGLRP